MSQDPSATVQQRPLTDPSLLVAPHSGGQGSHDSPAVYPSADSQPVDVSLATSSHSSVVIMLNPHKDQSKCARSQFLDGRVRTSFIRRVYAILAVQLVITVTFVTLFQLRSDIRVWSHAHPGVFYAAFGITLTTLVILACCAPVRRNFSGSFPSLVVLTVTEGFMLGSYSSTFSYIDVIPAAIIAVTVCLALTTIALHTECDVAGMFCSAHVVLIVLASFSAVSIFLHMLFPTLYLTYVAFGALQHVTATQLLLCNRRWSELIDGVDSAHLQTVHENDDWSTNESTFTLTATKQSKL